MQPLFIAADADGGIEEFAEARCGEEFSAWAVANDAAAAHEDDALNFRQDVTEVMGNEDEACAFSGQTAQGFAKFALRGEVERIRWLVEKKLAGTVDEGAGDEDAALFASGHFANELCGQVRGFHAGESFGGAGAHFIGDVEIGPESGGGEEAGDHCIKSRSDGGALSGQIGANHAEVLAQLRQIPAIAPEDAHMHAGLDDGVDLAGDGENKRGFAAAIGTEDGDVFPGTDGEIYIVKNDAFSARNVDVGQFEKTVGLRSRGDFVCSLGRGFHIC